ncbi:MAG: delta-lactam-biosynthetic de-N-acetylase [Clostridiaceae bacterium]
MNIKITLLASLIALNLFPSSNFSSKPKGEITTINTKEYDWYYESRSSGEPPLSPKETRDIISKYPVYYLGNIEKKTIYLTFDEGYENGYTETILDILKKHKVPAAFFVVEPYIKSNPEIVKRMEAEGHLVCNHSAHHPSMASVLDKEKFKIELQEVERIYKEVTGKEIAKFFRPPMGKYSELSLKYTTELGYKTIFWSFAYRDWIPEEQPSHEFAMNKILSKTHNGAIILLHAVSKTNAEILDQLITRWKADGYEIKSLEEL